MKIKYIKQMHNANVGEVLDIPDLQANVLVKLGVAEQYIEPVRKPRAKKEDDSE